MSAVSMSAIAMALGCAVMAGVYFTFSVFVMKALAVLPSSEGVHAMQSINEVILSSAFMPLFFGTSLGGVALAGWSATHLSEPGAGMLLAGALVYVFGMFVCTAAFNVPLNERLAALEGEAVQAASFWPRYVSEWTLWNHVRTVASAASAALFLFAATR